MQQVVSAMVGTTARGLPRYSGWICCSTDAKKLFRSMWRKRKRSGWGESGWMFSDMAVSASIFAFYLLYRGYFCEDPGSGDDFEGAHHVVGFVFEDVAVVEV